MKGFITFRRYYLDLFLDSTSFYGNVLDVGGKKENKRGLFKPPLNMVNDWKYLNIDSSTNPDFCCSAENIPVSEETFDMVLMSEVLEHLKNPQNVLDECYRIIAKGGKIIITIPFLYCIHADPYDYQRWTPEGIRRDMLKAGFEIQVIKPMGSLFAVIFDLVRNSFYAADNGKSVFKNIIVNRLLIPLMARIFMVLDRKFQSVNRLITTGYYVAGKKI